VDAYLVSLGEEAMLHNLEVANSLRQAGCIVMMDLEGRGMRAQMRSANKCNARFACILGEDELARKAIVVKNLATSDQVELPLDDPQALAHHLKQG